MLVDHGNIDVGSSSEEMTRDLERLAEHQVQLLLPAPAGLLATPLATSRDSNDSSNDDDQTRKKRKKTYSTRKVRSMGLPLARGGSRD